MTLSNQSIGLIIGGFLPAIVYGFSGVLPKVSNQAGIGIGLYTIIVGLAVTLTGLIIFFFIPDSTVNWKSGIAAFGFGLASGIGNGLVVIGLMRFKTPMSQLTPLYNMNTLIAVLLALWIFAEWKQVNQLQLIIGSVLIVLGGTLVARA
ncbi:MAG: hypothetical protein WCG83_06840 [Candidatus Peregrinibacteria bacterium]